jgi:hypothetical protein
MGNIGLVNSSTHPNQSRLDGILLQIIVVTAGNLIIYVCYFLFPRYTNQFKSSFVPKNEGHWIERCRHNYFNYNFSTYAWSLLFSALGYNVFFDILASLSKNNVTLTIICISLFSVMTIISYVVVLILIIIETYYVNVSRGKSLIDDRDVGTDGCIAVGILLGMYCVIGGVFKAVAAVAFAHDSNIVIPSFSDNFYHTYMFISMIVSFSIIAIALSYLLIFCAIVPCIKSGCYRCSCCGSCGQKVREAKEMTENAMSGYEINRRK